MINDKPDKETYERIDNILNNRNGRTSDATKELRIWKDELRLKLNTVIDTTEYKGQVCEHGKGVNSYCQACGRIHSL